jgi:hypothetical protein
MIRCSCSVELSAVRLLTEFNVSILFAFLIEVTSSVKIHLPVVKLYHPVFMLRGYERKIFGFGNRIARETYYNFDPSILFFCIPLIRLFIEIHMHSNTFNNYGDLIFSPSPISFSLLACDIYTLQ